MRINIAFVVAVLTALFAFGCGGNQSSGGPTPTQVVTVSVPSGQAAAQDMGDFSVNIPAGTFSTDTTVSIARYTISDRPTNPKFQPISDSMVEIKTDHEPRQDISLSINSRILGRVRESEYSWILAGKDSNGRWTSLSNFGSRKRGLTDAIIDKAKFVANGSVFQVAGLIGHVPTPSQPVPSRLYKFGDDDLSASPGTMLISTHGFNSNGTTMEPLMKLIQSEHLYRQVYIYEYDYRRDCSEIAADLNNRIKMQIQTGKFDFLPHSMGAAITRQDLEKLGLQNRVRNLISVCGANEGSIWYLSGMAKLVQYLRDDYLNNPDSNEMPAGFWAYDTPSAHDMSKGSDFLKALNADRISILGNTNYFLVSGTKDQVVGQNSALGASLPWATFTGGNVTTKIFDGFDHSGLVRTDQGRRQLVDYLKSIYEPAVDVEIHPGQTCSQSAGVYRFSLDIQNLSGKDIAVKDIQMYCFNGYADLVDMYWYNPSSATPYSWQYTGWNEHLTPDSDVEIEFEADPNNDNFPYCSYLKRDSCGSIVFSVRYCWANGQEGGGDRRAVVTLTSSGKWPAEPDISIRKR